MILKGTIKLAVIMGEQPKVSTVMTEFFVVDCPSSFNGVIRRSLLKALKTVTSIYCLTMKFPTVEGIRQVRRRQYDSRECYNKSLMLAKKERKLPQMMKVGKVSEGPMETNINPHL